jgi:hypothetical protein
VQGGQFTGNKFIIDWTVPNEDLESVTIEEWNPVSKQWDTAATLARGAPGYFVMEFEKTYRVISFFRKAGFYSTARTSYGSFERYIEPPLFYGGTADQFTGLDELGATADASRFDLRTTPGSIDAVKYSAQQIGPGQPQSGNNYVPPSINTGVAFMLNPELDSISRVRYQGVNIGPEQLNPSNQVPASINTGVAFSLEPELSGITITRFNGISIS